MFKRLGVGSNTLWRPKNPHSVDYLKYLHGVLIKNDKVSESNKGIIVEALRSITEILIWGDQNDSSVFDFFLERQMFNHFINIVKQRFGGNVNVQILQTLNILFENIRHETSLYFLLSNNHVNFIISYAFDFTNEELLAYYVSFLKVLSFKLNPHTVHFFFNEATGDFPLFIEALKFFNHSESMVRIAVRTLTLNVFKLKDINVMKFVVSRAQDYFSKLVHQLAQQVIEMDTFARSAQNEESNRERLLSMLDVHLDHLHYINDILMVKHTELSSILVNKLNNLVINPLYMASLASLRETPSTILLSKVSAMFLLSHLTLIIHDENVMQSLLTSLFFGDENEVRCHWTRNIDRGLQLDPRVIIKDPTERLFFFSHIGALADNLDDHCTFYSLLLIYAICQNRDAKLYSSEGGITNDILEAAQLPCNGNNAKCSPHLAENLLTVIGKCRSTDSTLRPVTLELCCIVVRCIILALEDDDVLVERMISLAIDVQKDLSSRLREVVFSEDLFLEMFEEEYHSVEQNVIRLNNVSSDPGLYLPPTNTPLSKLPLRYRHPCGNEEKIRKALQFLFTLRKFVFDLRGEQESILPLNSRLQLLAEVDDCINLNNCDLLSCSVSTTKNEKLPRFLVTDRFQLILVEPDSRRLGWAIVRFAGLLQDTHLTGDPTDGRILHVVVEDVKCRLKSKSSPQLSAKLVFDDHIRCMAAKQRLSKGRATSRVHKLSLINELLGGVTANGLNQTGTNNQRSNGKSSTPGAGRLVSSDKHSLVPDDPTTTPPTSTKP